VDSIELEIGTQAGIEFDALDFAWDVGVRNTVLQQAERKIDKVQAMARCSCGCEYPVMENKINKSVNCTNLIMIIPPQFHIRM
jgi:Zn finger protein HypA/HybF involved in hydrogenase expression